MPASRGWVLCYRRDERKNQLHPVAFASCALSAACSGVGTSALPCLLVWPRSDGHYRLFCCKKTILQTPSPSGKHARWWLRVFAGGVGKVQMEYRPGRENARADALSRNPVDTPISVQA